MCSLRGRPLSGTWEAAYALLGSKTPNEEDLVSWLVRGHVRPSDQAMSGGCGQAPRNVLSSLITSPVAGGVGCLSAVSYISNETTQGLQWVMATWK